MLGSRREANDGEFHLVHVKHEHIFLRIRSYPVEATVDIVAVHGGEVIQRFIVCVTKRRHATPFSGDRGVDEGLEQKVVFQACGQHSAHHPERQIILVVVGRNEERVELAPALAVAVAAAAATLLQ
jgi:hypothetical protein